MLAVIGVTLWLSMFYNRCVEVQLNTSATDCSTYQRLLILYPCIGIVLIPSEYRIGTCKRCSHLHTTCGTGNSCVLCVPIYLLVRLAAVIVAIVLSVLLCIDCLWSLQSVACTGRYK